MSKHHTLAAGERLFASWTNNIQEFISTIAPNLKLSKASSTVVQVVASTGNEQVGVGIGGRWRFNSATVNVTVSGGAGIKDIWACAETENNFAGGGADPDETIYTFILKATEHGVNPAGVAAFRKIGEATWSGTEITALKQVSTNAISGAQLEDAALAASTEIEWTREPSGALTPKLISPNNSVYKMLLMTPGLTTVAGAVSGNNYYFQRNSGFAVSGSTSDPASIIDLAAADLAVASRTTKLRIKMQVSVRETAPGAAVITAGLYPVSIVAGNWTLGAVSAVIVASSGLAKNTISPFTSADIALPADGRYLLGFKASGEATPADIATAVQLQVRNV